MSASAQEEPRFPFSALGIIAIAIALAVVIGGLAVIGHWTYLMIAVVVGVPAMFMLLSARKRKLDSQSI